jgi:hypothetical protein
MIINLIANLVKATSNFFSINCVGFERECYERAKPFRHLWWGMLKPAIPRILLALFFVDVYVGL